MRYSDIQVLFLQNVYAVLKKSGFVNMFLPSLQNCVCFTKQLYEFREFLHVCAQTKNSGDFNDMVAYAMPLYILFICLIVTYTMCECSFVSTPNVKHDP